MLSVFGEEERTVVFCQEVDYYQTIKHDARAVATMDLFPFQSLDAIGKRQQRHRRDANWILKQDWHGSLDATERLSLAQYYS